MNSFVEMGFPQVGCSLLFHRGHWCGLTLSDVYSFGHYNIKGYKAIRDHPKESYEDGEVSGGEVI